MLLCSGSSLMARCFGDHPYEAFSHDGVSGSTGLHICVVREMLGHHCYLSLNGAVKSLPLIFSKLDNCHRLGGVLLWQERQAPQAAGEELGCSRVVNTSTTTGWDDTYARHGPSILVQCVCERAERLP